MKRGCAAIILFLITLSIGTISALPSDTLRVDKDIINIERMEALVEYDPLFYKTLKAKHEVVRVTLKNYYPEETIFDFEVEARYVSNDLMTDFCPEDTGRFCFPKETVVISYPQSRAISGQDFSQILLEFAVSEEAQSGRFYVKFRAIAEGEEYASQDFILNIGKENFPFGKENEKEEVSRHLPLLVLFAFLLVLLVFGLVLISKGRGGY